MSRPRGRPLFEVVRDQQRGTRFGGPPVSVDPVAPRGVLPKIDAGGVDADEPPRTLRIPTGYLAVAGGVWIISVVAAFSIGFSRGGTAALEEARQERISSSALLGGNDGSGEQRTGDSAGALPQGRQSPDQGLDRTANSRQTPTGPVTRPDLSEDTRVAGLNYIVVERFPPEEAVSVAEFLIARGIDVMVLPDKDQRLRRVVTRRGFEGWRSNTEARTLEQELLRLGRVWKSQGGSKDFSQLLPQKYEK